MIINKSTLMLLVPISILILGILFAFSLYSKSSEASKKPTKNKTMNSNYGPTKVSNQEYTIEAFPVLVTLVENLQVEGTDIGKTYVTDGSKFFNITDAEKGYGLKVTRNATGEEIALYYIPEADKYDYLDKLKFQYGIK